MVSRGLSGVFLLTISSYKRLEVEKKAEEGGFLNGNPSLNDSK
jgi:hypothetical protein